MQKNKIAGYYRISIEDEVCKEESSSIANQRLIIKRYLAERQELSGYEYCEYYDDGASGTSMNRPGMQAMLEMIRQNKIKCVIVKDLSRFSRDYIELGTYMEQVFPSMGIRFISISDHYDSNDYIGTTADIDIGFKSLLADFYCKDISEKVRSAVLAKKNQGNYATGNTPFGYMKNGKHSNELVIVPEEAEVIRHIFEMALSGKNLTQICRALNDEGIQTPLEYKDLRKKQCRKERKREHKYWQQGTVRTILVNESYIGSMVYHKSAQEETGSRRTIVRPRSEWNVYKNHHEAIISREVFEKVQERFCSKKESERNPVLYALKGKVYCEYCGRKLRVMKLAGGKLFFYCSYQKLSSGSDCIEGSISNEFLEEIVLQEIRKQIMNIADFDRIIKKGQEKQREAIQKNVRETAGIAAEITQMKEKKAQLLETYHMGNVTKQQYMARHRQLAEQISEKQDLQEKAKVQMAACHARQRSDTLDYESFLQFAGFTALTKEMADVFVEKIQINSEKSIDICFTFAK